MRGDGCFVRYLGGQQDNQQLHGYKHMWRFHAPYPKMKRFAFDCFYLDMSQPCFTPFPPKGWPVYLFSKPGWMTSWRCSGSVAALLCRFLGGPRIGVCFFQLGVLYHWRFTKPIKGQGGVVAQKIRMF